jgi:hypothetical protein
MPGIESFDQFSSYNEPEGYEYVGGGIEADVWRGKQTAIPSIHKIIKNTDSDYIKKGAYLNYIFLSKKYANQNPFFPRVESIQHTPDRGFVIELEELQPLYDASNDDLRFILKGIFNQELYNQAISEIWRYGENTHPELYRFSRWISGPISRYSTAYINPRIRSKQFIDFCALVRKIIKRTKCRLDLHEENMMIRRTGVGPQLVITDPVVDKAETC